MEDPLPVNLGLRVKPPRTSSSIPVVGVDGLCDFDALDTVGVRVIRLLPCTLTYLCVGIGQKRVAIAELIDSLPPVGCLSSPADSRYSRICRFRR